ncbi:diguanylate cyclase/phosphodiesterase (GGDEF & EAL domains) with PAS/PAC sensor(s) [hydrothermal vent metagenome]|uniref:Diguanylate cyclase/phosphodiesterase (GGDEF & EAL domains) with PAS/PAC sensor(S) n=1 Tax=hydrothermal vent metagenome TaxID=652676 RepID=A0A3B0ZMX9_9ZZZZ
MLKLGGKLILGVLLTLGTTLFVGLYFALDRQTSDMLGEVRDNSTSISNIVSLSVGEFLGEIKNQHDQMQNLVVELTQRPDVESILVLDEDRHVIAHENFELVGIRLENELLSVVENVFKNGQQGDIFSIDEFSSMRFIPVIEEKSLGDQVIGVVVLSLVPTTSVDHSAEAVSYIVKQRMTQILLLMKDKKYFLNNLVTQVRGILEVMNLEVYNEQIMLLQSYGDRQLVDPVILSSSIKQVFKSGDVHESGGDSVGYYQRLEPIFFSDDGEVIGVVRLVMNLQPALDNVASFSQSMRLIALIMAIAIFFVLSWLMQRVIIQPIRSLSESAQLLAQGHFHKVAVLDTQDEIAQLGHSFNRMVDYLSDSQESLINANEYNEKILRTMGDALFVIGVDNRIEHINDAALKLLHYAARTDVIGFPLSLVCSDTPDCKGEQLSFLMENYDFNDQEKYLITRTGSYVPVLFSFSHIYDTNGDMDGAVCVARDITERKRTEQILRDAHTKLELRVKHRTEELFQEKERLQVTLRSIAEAVVTVDNTGQIAYFNPAAERVTGWLSHEAVGRALEEVLPFFDDNSERMDSELLKECIDQGHCGQLSMNYSMNLLNRYEAMVAIESTIAPMLDNNGNVTGIVVVFRDVSEERQLRKQLLHQANHDALTGLFNRLVFEKKLSEALNQARTTGTEHAVLFLDLDQFKVVNDTCGHVAGDALLQQLTSLLREKMRATDILARLGGDEFGVALSNCSLDHAKKIALSLLDTVREFRFIWEDKTFEVGVSIGLVMLDENSKSVASIMSAADIACYAAKDGGRNRYHLYESSDTELKQRHGEMQWVTLISKAIAEDRFVLHLQEIKALKGDQQGGHYEVLLRMVGDSGDLIPPGAFLPAAERYGLIANVDRWVIEKGLGILVKYLERNPGESCVFAINLSGLSIGDDGFLEYVQEQITRHQLPHHCICFEITETAAVANLTHARRFIKALRALGCKFALDDFGSGVSSFSYLKNLPVDFLKIDGMFVRDMAEDSIDYAMVEAINHIGQVMGLKTIAEFVESQAILDCLIALEVDYAQGYFIGEPVPLEDID